MSLPQIFIDEIGSDLFKEDKEKQSCFLHRFDRANHPDNNKDDKEKAQNKAVAELINRDLNQTYCKKNIGHTIRKVLEVLYGEYGEEMKADGVAVDKLFNVGKGGKLKSANKEDDSEGKNQEQSQGKFSPWQEVYKWLWGEKFLRFIWEKCQEKADAGKAWMEFCKNEEIPDILSQPRGLVLEELEELRQEKMPKIPLLQPQSLLLFFPPETKGYFLLLNKGNKGCYVLCPSLGYAVNCCLKSTVILPQGEARAGQNKLGLKYDALGVEEFIAIAHPEPLNLPWLDVSKEKGEIAPALTSDRLLELWEEFEKQGEWRGYYQAFEVVEA